MRWADAAGARGLRAAAPLALAAGVALLAAAAGCQAILGLEEGKPRPAGEGGGGAGTTTSSGGGEGGGSSGSGGSGGSGGTGGGGGGGAGGGPTCTDGQQNGGEIGVDCGPGCDPCPPLLLLGSGPAGASLVVGEMDPATGDWTSSTLAGSSATPPSLAMTSASTAVGLLCPSLEPPGSPPLCQLQFVTWNAAQGWAAPADVPLSSPALQTSHVLAPASSGARAIFHNEVYKYDLGTYDGAAWTAAADPVGGPGTFQNYGPVGADITALGNKVAVAFLNGGESNHLQVRRYEGGLWGVIEDIATNTNFNVAPRIVALQGATPELLVVYVQSGSSQIGYRISQGQDWLLGVTNLGSTGARPALAALPGGGAILAYQGTNNKLYHSFYTSMGWSAPAQIPTVMEDLAAPPAVVAGAAGASVDLAYLTAGGVVRHVRYQGAWSEPKDIGTFPGVAHVALSSAPPRL